MRRNRYRAPTVDRTILAVPSLAEWPALVASNRRHFEQHGRLSFGPMTLAAWRELARAELAAAGSAPPTAEQPWIVTGHQPELIHPGVWAKEVAVAAAAEHLGGVGLHLIVDSDTVKQTAVRVLSGSVAEPAVALIAFDRWAGEEPYEGRPVLEPTALAAFLPRVEEAMALYPWRPSLRDCWPQSMAAAGPGPLTDWLTGPRRALNRRLGIRLAEAALSTLAPTVAWRLFVADLARRAEEFSVHHNAAVAAYRKANKVASRHHPFPDLELASGGAVELPLWAWEASRRRRERVFVSRQGADLLLSAGGATIGRLPASAPPIGPAERALDQAGVLDLDPHWAVRSRAIATTLFLRLALADLFVHGIGGGKYDEVTDQVIAPFYGLPAPRYAVLTATLRLPTGQQPVDPDRLAAARRHLRDLHWNPDRYLDDALIDQDPIASWIEKKYELCEWEEDEATHRERAERYQKLRALNQQLRRFLGTQPADAERDLRQLLTEQARAQILGSREYPACLHPWETLAGLRDQIRSQFSSSE